VRRIALALLGQARAAAARLDDAEDAEALHDFRVAIRRLRSTLRAWRPELGKSVSKGHRRALRQIQQSTGGGRDAEVALEWLAEQRGELRALQRHGHDWLVDRLTERRVRAMDQLCQQVRADFERIEDALRDHLEVLQIEVRLDHPPEPERFADALSAHVRRHSDRLVTRLVRIASPEDRSECHRTRIACKRLRYLVEPVRPFAPQAAEVVKQCKQLQDLLGDLNDAHVLQDALASALEEASVEHARRLHDVAREPDPELLQQEMRRSPRAGLAELTRRDQLRIRKGFEKLEKRWIAPHAAALVEAVERLCEGLESQATAAGRPPEPERG
jgi:CHAD domain-containing protein